MLWGICASFIIYILPSSLDLMLQLPGLLRKSCSVTWSFVKSVWHLGYQPASDLALTNDLKQNLNKMLMYNYCFECFNMKLMWLLQVGLFVLIFGLWANVAGVAHGSWCKAKVELIPALEAENDQLLEEHPLPGMYFDKTEACGVWATTGTPSRTWASKGQLGWRSRSNLILRKSRKRRRPRSRKRTRRSKAWRLPAACNLDTLSTKKAIWNRQQTAKMQIEQSTKPEKI